ncbi:MAG: branched-chain-amino-acid transaminase [Aigarchaeota archaeon]|nr:branched-chain-amino-acid transaminase [Aigarchaeota archaeon]MCX8192420.1 branched-chain-amino-acid transaminase [Nitrososphaeria archaeon]MDW7986626.1 branched-chain-amino-acid transaminase [Nitrososphaerota archaeon]
MSRGEFLVYVDGEYIPRSQARVSVFDHGFLYGDGVFEGIRCYDGVVFKLVEHIDRLYESAKSIMLDVPMKKEEMVNTVLETIRKNGLRDAYIRLIVTRGVGDLGLDPRKCSKPSIIIIVQPMEPLLGREVREKGVKLIISSVRRDRVDATSHQAKTLNYLNSILAKIEAINAGVDDAILLDDRGFVSEASAANLFIVKNSVISTPPQTAGILPGITRSVVIELAKKIGYRIEERDITPYELYTADEVFLTGTAAELVPVIEISKRKIGDGVPGPITKKLIEEFDKVKRDPSYGVKVY